MDSYYSLNAYTAKQTLLYPFHDEKIVVLKVDQVHLFWKAKDLIVNLIVLSNVKS